MSVRSLLLALTMAVANVAATGHAVPPVCEVGEPNCMPAPDECLTGEYEGGPGVQLAGWDLATGEPAACDPRNEGDAAAPARL